MKLILKSLFIEVRAFLRSHIWHILLIPILGITLYTFIHEAAHALAVIYQGGEVLSFRWLPGEHGFGEVRYLFKNGVSYSNFLIGMAPYMFWLAIAVLTFIIFMIWPPKHFIITSSIFIWLYCAPLGDIAMAAMPYVLYWQGNDFHNTFGNPSLKFSILLALGGFIAMVLGWFFQNRLYRERSLSPKAYAFLSFFIIAGLSLL